MEREVQNTYSFIKLIKQIERFPSLYNYNLQDYSNKAVTDKLWAEIAKKTNGTVGECKEKWRNIRSSFLRSRKAPTNGSRPKKVYYLAEHLEFVLPFLKSRDVTWHREDEEQESIGESDTQSQDCNFEVEKSEVDDFEVMNKEEDDRNFFTEPSITNVVNRKRYISEDETNEDVKRKDNPKAAKSTHPMHYFFLSLLDEFDTMDERQIRQFKIRVLQVIDDIKASKVTQPFGVSVSPESFHVAFKSSPAYATSQNLVAYSTKYSADKKNTQTAGPSSSSRLVGTKQKYAIEKNVQDAEFEGDAVIKLDNDFTFD
ncbi:uncharacterized protein LOC134746391 [Cydia strobilella]|uniref:uncharacterized protein LOC134746391 n=1 Tax=Cydia strobilella TaxID=1100964 RepID=UPI003007749E